jgi:uncharacterized protein
LGNIMDVPMMEMVASDSQRQFGLDKRDTLPRYCRECDVRFACHGECPKNRFLTTPDGEDGLNHLCAGWKAFFHRIDEPLQMMATLMRMGRPASEIIAVMAGKEDEWQKALAQARARRNDDCPCNSGLKFAQCHGWKRPARGQKRRGTGARRPRPPVRAQS